jgi:hypothetical protein
MEKVEITCLADKIIAYLGQEIGERVAVWQALFGTFRISRCR